MSSQTKTKAAVLTQVQALIAGTQKHFPSGQFTLGNTTYTTATLTQALQSQADALAAMNAAHVRVKDAGQALQTTQTQVAPILRDYKRYVLAAFATAPQQLADFGLQAPKARTPLSTEKRAAATVKMRATRAARGTTSKKQKLAVKGDVTGVTISPVPTPATSTPAVSTPAALQAAAASPTNAPSVSVK